MTFYADFKLQITYHVRVIVIEASIVETCEDTVYMPGSNWVVFHGTVFICFGSMIVCVSLYGARHTRCISLVQRTILKASLNRFAVLFRYDSIEGFFYFRIYEFAKQLNNRTLSCSGFLCIA